MTRYPHTRTVGTLCLGTVLLGVGCSEADRQTEPEKLSFPEKTDEQTLLPAPDGAYPHPSFGPLARKTLAETKPANHPELQLPVAPQLADPQVPTAQREVAEIRRKLLASGSDDTHLPPTLGLSAGAAETPPQPPIANDLAYATETDTSDTQKPLAEPSDAPAPTTVPEIDEAGALQAAMADLPSEAPHADALQADPVPQSQPSPDPEATQLESEQPASLDSFARLFAAPHEPHAAHAAQAPSAPAPAAVPAESEPPDSRKRTIAARSEAPMQGDAAPAPSPAPPAPRVTVPASAAKPTTLAAMIPPPRAPIPMVTTELPAVDAQPPEPANDRASVVPDRPVALDRAPPPSFAPPARTATTLGLGTAKPPPSPASPAAPPATAQLGPDRGAGFSVSAEPPELSYQDELILELRVKGIDASDTILAYGTRSGVYLPIGTLARILDLAITVSGDGTYANGWVLDQKRTLSIDLTRYLLTLNGKEQSLPRDAAVAFDGELYLLADRIQDFLPVKVTTDLRGQVITLETLEPFPFEERMKREADRRRLASRTESNDKPRFPRQETPWLFVSPPVADVELRAVSDSVFGPRGEVDVQLASDLGFLTAQGFVSADSENGLTASLITLGRQDPDAKLLGPLAATAFSAGDVSTVSLPLGLRSVTGRGFVATNTPAEAVSVFEQIDLRGVLPDGYEVELYRNDILVGSTRNAVNGQYEFLQVPVDFGLNIFRLVFFGPQGQRSEEVRRISVGDGRLPQGKLVYRFGAAQKDENLLGVRPPNYIAPRDRGNWRASAEIAYGLSPDVTAIVSGGWFEPLDSTERWLASAGIRTGLGGYAIKADVAAQSGNAYAFSGGVGGQIGASAFTFTHTEFSGDFIDETANVGGAGLRRTTELDFNTVINLGGATGGLALPVTSRIRHFETQDGRAQTDAALRTSARFSGLMASNTLEYSRTGLAGATTQSRIFGNFDLASVGRSKTRGRLSLGYRISPDPEVTTAALEIDHALDKDTAIRGSVGYAFETRSTQIGLSAVRDFDRFRLAVDGNYGFQDKSYSIGLRLGMSIGHDPLRGGLFIARPGLSSGGAVSARAFRDLDGDGLFGAGDTPLPDVDIVAFNQAVPTDSKGIGRLGRLGSGRAVGLQVDPSSLPDIDLVPAAEGMEIVPRPGRIHTAQFPIIALSEVEGTLLFEQGNGNKGVSGVRLILRDAAGKDVGFAKTEMDGYFFFERVRPGQYTVALDPEQSQRLNLCAQSIPSVTVDHEADLLRADVTIGLCQASAMVPQ